MLKDINKFRKEFMGSHYKPMTKGKFKSLKNNSQVFVATIDGKAVGLIVLTLSDSLTRRSLVIEDIIVSKNNRRNGLGSEGMNEIIKMAKKLKADCIEVATKQTNKPAQALYKKFGFKDRKQISYRLWIKKG